MGRGAGRRGSDADSAGDDWRPRPDPTTLTTELVGRAIAGFREVVEARLDGMDRATELEREDSRQRFDEQLSALRELILSRIGNVSDVTAEKFNAVDTRFLERDTRTEQAAVESRISLDAALAAAKEAVSEQNKANAQAIAKSEVATQKQIDAMGLVTSTGMKSLEDKIADAVRRLDRGEGQTSGAQVSRTEARLDRGSVAALVTVALSVVAVVATIVIAVVTHR